MSRFFINDDSCKHFSPIYGYHNQPLLPLEKALQPIEPLIKELSDYIKEAKNYSYFPTKHGLSKDESAAIYIYTMEWGTNGFYRVLNNALRSENRQDLKNWFPYLKLLDTALDKLPTVKGKLWRGMAHDIGKDYIKNEIFTWWSVNSCSSSLDAICSFTGNGNTDTTVCSIQAFNGKNISGYTKYEKENEVILKMGTKLRVKGNLSIPAKRVYVVDLMEIVTDNHDETLILPKNDISLIKNPSYPIRLESFTARIDNYSKWKQDGITIAGGNELNQLFWPGGICVDDYNQCIYIADSANHRIVKWNYNAKNGKVVAGGHENGNQINQLSLPSDVVIDRNNDSLIICDEGNKRIVRWSLRYDEDPQIIISNIDCFSLTMDNNGDIYVSNCEKDEVRRWKIGEKNGTIVAGGNGRGDKLNQLNYPTYIFVDEDYSVYISDSNNHRVVKWMKDAKVGVVVAGGHGEGNTLTQLSYPYGLIVDHLGNVYVADSKNNRIVRWLKESTEGECIVDQNQFNDLQGLSFDRQGNLYAVERDNNRIQKFEIINRINQ